MSKLEISTEVLDALQQLSTLLESDDALEQTLNTVVELSASVLPGCDSTGVMLHIGGKATTAAASDDYTLGIDEIQYDSGQGPCLQAIKDSQSYKIEAVSEETRWPEFCRRASEKGFGSSLSYPLSHDDVSLGSLNMYARKERVFDDAAVRVADIFAKQANIALHNAQTYVAARRLSDQLNDALKTRDMIGQAKGILMEREGITDQEAFDMLRTISQNSNIKLREVAQKLMEEKSKGR